MFEWIQAHPAETLILVANAISNGLRLAYLDEADRPRWVRFVLGFIDIPALNWWSPVKRMQGK